MRIQKVPLAKDQSAHTPSLDDGGAELTLFLQANVEAQQERSRPLIIICPGGGYSKLSDRESEPVALAFLARGFQVAILRYPLVTNAESAPLLPAPQLALAHAVAAARSNADAWQIDADRITVLGFSAGANVCALYTGLCHDEQFCKEAGVPSENLRVAAQVLCYPVIDMHAGWPNDAERLAAISNNPTYEAAQNLISSATPPTFIWQTAADEAVPVSNSYLYAAELARQGIDHECHIFHRGSHGLSLATEQAAKDTTGVDARIASWIDLATGWLKEIGAGPISL